MKLDRATTRRVAIQLVSPAIIAALLLLVYAGLTLSSGVRAYVGGESLWSKGQKVGVQHLMRYAETLDEREFAAYRAAQSIPDADRRARLALDSGASGVDAGIQAFIDGGNHPRDAVTMAWIYRHLGWVSYMHRAIAIWTAGDSLRDKLDAAALELQAVARDGASDPRLMEQKLDKIAGLDASLTSLEAEFSATLGEGARWLSDLILLAALVAGTCLMGVGAAISVRLLRQEQHTAQIAMRSEEEVRALVEHSPDVIARFDRDLRRTFVNASMARETGIPIARLLGHTLDEVEQPEHFHRGLAAALRACFASGHGSEVELEYDGPHGARTFHIRLSPERAPDGTVETILVVARDMTQLKASQLALRERDEQLRHVQKMEAIGRLAGGVAHDFNNLLSVMRGNLDLAMDSVRSGQAPVEEISEAIGAVDRASSLTRQLLTFSRRQVAQPRLLQLNNIVAELQGMLQRMIGEQIALQTELDPQLPRVEADPGQMEQVLLNLVVHARDAMPDGGELRIVTRASATGPRAASRGGSAPRARRWCVVEVHDTGDAMDEATRSRIFEPFSSAKSIGMGSGLGLATAYGIATGSGGDIEVESEKDKGTCFRVYLPASDHTETPPDVAVAGTALGGSETILVVEDESAVRQLARRLLSSKGYTVLEATNGSEALELLAARHAEIDLVLSDVVMPVLGGRTLSAEMKRLEYRIPMVFMSGYTDNSEPLKDPSGATAPFVAKPFTAATLLESVRRTLDRSRPMARRT
jgi:PAS domain S-box-containing protein